MTPDPTPRATRVRALIADITIEKTNISRFGLESRILALVTAEVEHRERENVEAP